MRVIHQGDIYRVQMEHAEGSEPGIPHPGVVVQADALNHSRITTVVVRGLTSNLKRVALPGNVLLDAGEANLSPPSVVEVSKVSTVEKSRHGAYIGTVSAQRVDEILAGMCFQQTSYLGRWGVYGFFSRSAANPSPPAPLPQGEGSKTKISVGV